MDEDVPKILFIRGVFVEDCVPIDQLFEQQLMTGLDNEIVIKPTAQYDKLPSIFYSLEQWPEKIKLHCWYCDRMVNGVPIFVPKYIEPSANGPIMGVDGCYCNFNCAVSGINLYYPDKQTNKSKKDMLKFLYNMFCGKSITEICPAVSKTEMIKYGGDLTEQEYGEKCKAKHKAFKKKLRA